MLSVSLSVAYIVGALYVLYVGREFIHMRFYVYETSKRIMVHFLQLSVLYAVFHLYILVDKAFASYLGEKAVSALAYGLLIVGIPKNILKFENIAVTLFAEQGGSKEKIRLSHKRFIIFFLYHSFASDETSFWTLCFFQGLMYL